MSQIEASFVNAITSLPSKEENQDISVAKEAAIRLSIASYVQLIYRIKNNQKYVQVTFSSKQNKEDKQDDKGYYETLLRDIRRKYNDNTEEGLFFKFVVDKDEHILFRIMIYDGDQVKFSDSDLGKEVCYFLKNFDVFKVASLEFQQKLVSSELLNDDFYYKKGFVFK